MVFVEKRNGVFQDPPFTVLEPDGKAVPARAVHIMGPADLRFAVDEADRPGTRKDIQAWIETTSGLIISPQ